MTLARHAPRPQRRHRARLSRLQDAAVVGQADHEAVRRPVRREPRARRCAASSAGSSSTSATSTTAPAGSTRPTPRSAQIVRRRSQRVRELLVQGGTDTAGPTARSAIADEIDQLIESVKQEANVQYGGRYIFSGTATDTAALHARRRRHLRGRRRHDHARDRPRRRRSRSTSDVRALLGDGQAARDDKLLNTLRDISAHLRGGTTADADALRTTDLQRLDANLDTLNGMPRRRRRAHEPPRRSPASRLSELERVTRPSCCRTPRTPTWQRRSPSTRPSRPPTAPR